MYDVKGEKPIAKKLLTCCVIPFMPHFGEGKTNDGEQVGDHGVRCRGPA